MESKTREPQKIVYMAQSEDRWLVWPNTESPQSENSFSNETEAYTFARAWANGIMAMENIECKIVVTKFPEAETTTEAASDFVNAMMPLIQLLNKEIPKVIDGAVVFKRIYLGSTYAYNLLSRCKFLVKSPKTVSIVSGVIIWIFMHLPKWFILRWPMPNLRD